jgi:hypothetical protein
MWKIRVDKRSRYLRELDEAKEIWEECNSAEFVDHLDKLKSKGKNALQEKADEEEENNPM